MDQTKGREVKLSRDGRIFDRWLIAVGGRENLHRFNVPIADIREFDDLKAMHANFTSYGKSFHLQLRDDMNYVTSFKK